MMLKMMTGFILSIVSFVTMAHPGHGPHNLIVASGDLHPYVDASNLFILLMTGAALLYLVAKNRKKDK